MECFGKSFEHGLGVADITALKLRERTCCNTDPLCQPLQGQMARFPPFLDVRAPLSFEARFDFSHDFIVLPFRPEKKTALLKNVVVLKCSCAKSMA